jgi:hypothetical protein
MAIVPIVVRHVTARDVTAAMLPNITQELHRPLLILLNETDEIDEMALSIDYMDTFKQNVLSTLSALFYDLCTGKM